jgi:hypothetical protein
MINAIKLPALPKAEFIQLMTDILAIVQKNDPVALQVTEPFNKLKALTNEIEALFKVQYGNEKSNELIVLDTRRDNAINGLQSIINGYTYHTNGQLKASALLLQNHLANFGSGIASDNYQSQTATIRNILDDYSSKPDLAAAIAGLQLEPWFDELAESNTLFAEWYLAPAAETGAASPDNIKGKRTEANNEWYALHDLISAYFTIKKGATPYGDTVAFINGLIEYYNNLIARRRKGEEVTDSSAKQPA